MFPDPLLFYKEDGSQTKITGALAVTRKPVLYAESAYRDDFSAAFVGTAFPNILGVNESTAGAGRPGYAGGVIGTAAAGAVGLYTTRIPTTLSANAVSIPDSIGHVPWRIKEYLRYKLEFWDALTVGLAMTMSVTTVSGSAIITVGNNELLTPGQGIVGTGIATGAIVQAILPVSEGMFSKTSVILSHVCSASATVTATLTGANRRGSVFEDEFIDDGSLISFPT